MLKTFVTSARIVEFEPRLSDYLATGQSDFTTIVAKAKEVLTQDLKSNKLELKKLCTPLSLQSSVSKTTSFTGEQSDLDVAERRMWILTTTAVGATETFTLKGTNDGDTWTTVTSIDVTTNTETSTIFDDVYKYYRVDYSGTSATYSSDLYEESFHLAHIYLSLAMSYEQLRTKADQLWAEKSEMYYGKYGMQVKNIVYTYDDNLSDSISTGEERQTYRATFHR